MKYIVCVIEKDGRAYFGDIPTNKAKAERWAKTHRKGGVKAFAVRLDS